MIAHRDEKVIYLINFSGIWAFEGDILHDPGRPHNKYQYMGNILDKDGV